MRTPTPTHSRAIAVALVATVLATIIVLAEVAAQRDDCCAGKPTVAAVYAHRNTGIDRLLVTGDGQVFAALAQDPLLRRPEVFYGAAEFAYRAQRPGWGYLAWALSLGQPDLTGWALAALAAVACGAACGVAARLLEQRGASPWWALTLVIAGMETLMELTPELAAFALFAGGLLLWQRDRRVLAIGLLCGAVATRETMLVGVVAVALWELARPTLDGRRPWRRVAPLAWPFVWYAGWASLLLVRVGRLPTAAAGGRAGLPGEGLLHALDRTSDAGTLVVGLGLAVTLCAAAWVLARRDVLTWIALAYLVFSSTLAPVVWSTHAGFTRVLLPLYGFALIAVVGVVGARRRILNDGPATAEVPLSTSASIAPRA